MRRVCAYLANIFDTLTLFSLHLVTLCACASTTQVDSWTFVNPACQVPAFELVQTFDVPDSSAFGYTGIDHQHEAIIVAFQGTKDQINWVGV
jgi:hypothetical protein